MRIALLITIILVLLLVTLYFMLIGCIDKSEPQIVSLPEPISIIGLEIATSDKDIYRDVGTVANRFNSIKEKHPIPNVKEPWARIFASKDYNPETGTFTYIVGDVVTTIDSIPHGLRAYNIPATTYAVFRIKPKSRMAWGITMGRMKRFIYTQWLPNSPYSVSSTFGDFELHNEMSMGKSPEIRLYVTIEGKEGI